MKPYNHSGRIAMLGVCLIQAVALGPRVIQAADFNSWEHKMNITFPGYVPATGAVLTNFPALVVLNEGIVGFQYADFLSPPNGDLRFTASDGTTELNYEIESWNTSGSSYIWVQVSALENAATSIRAYWGKAGMTSPAYTTGGATWSANFAGVWHLKETGFNYADSSAYNHPGISGTAPSATAGKIAGGQSFNSAASQYIDVGSTVFNETTPFTISAWVMPNAGGTAVGRGSDGSGKGWSVAVNTSPSGVHDIGIVVTSSQGGGSQAGFGASGTTVGSPSRWDHLTAVWKRNSGGYSIYVNGKQEGVTTAMSYYYLRTSTVGIRLGRVNALGYYSGKLDEVQISNVARPAQWIWASFMSQGSNSVFTAYAMEFSAKPIVFNAGATNITLNSAQLNGTLSSTGTTATAVYCFWGTADGGTNQAAWAHTNTWAAPQNLGPVDFVASELASNTTHFYRFAASNQGGLAWASPTASFITGELGVETVSDADESTLTPGVFAVYRPGTATNVPLTVTYAQTGGTATAGVHFVALNGTVVIPAGTNRAYIAVTPIRNYALNGDTTLQLTLTGAQAVLGASSNATMTIVNVSRPSADLYVSQSGSNSGGLDWATAYTSIQSALNDAVAGDTIHVAGGQAFSLTAPIAWPATANLTLRGGYEAAPGSAPGANDPGRWPTTIQTAVGANVRLFTLSSVAGVTLETLTLRDGRERGSQYGGGISANAVSGLTVRSCRFLRNSIIVDTHGYGGALAAVGSSGTISNCVFFGNYTASTTGHIDAGRGGALYLNGGSWTLRDLQLHGNFTAAQSGSRRSTNTDAAGGLWLGGAGASFAAKNLLIVNNDSGGLRVDAGSATLENLTVSGNNPVGVSIAAASAATSTLRNSILHGNRDDFSGSLPTLQNNIIGDATQNGVDGNLDDDPEFVFPLFYVSETSPCLDSGTGTVAEAGLAGLTTLTNGVADSGTVDRGYHFLQGVVFDVDLYVSTGGNNINNGLTPAQSLRSITRALELAGLSARIHIATGTYARATETFPLTINARTVQLLGAGAATTIIDAGGANRRVVSIIDAPFGDNRIEGLTLRGGSSDSLNDGGGLRIDGATLSLAQAVVRQNQVSGNPIFGGGVAAVDATVFIRDSAITNNASICSVSHEHNSRGGGLAAKTAVSLRLWNSVVSDNVTRLYTMTYSLDNGGGVWLGVGRFDLRNVLLAGNTGGGVVADSILVAGGSGSGVSIFDNLTVFTNNADGIRMVSGAAAVSTIRNTITYGNTADDYDGNVPLVFAHNCIGDGTQNGIAGNISADPRFINAPGRDFRLSNNSAIVNPCINVGTNLPWMEGSTDLPGNPRILVRTVDLGAYEAIPLSGTVLLIR